MAVGLPLKTTYANGDVYSASDVNDTNGTINITAAPFAAGKNKIINGDFGIWQRGISITVPIANNSFSGPDRFQFSRNGSSSVVTVSREAFTPGTAPQAGYEGNFFMRFNQTTAGSGGSYNQIITRMENVTTYAGQTVTFSFWAKADSSRTLRVPVLNQNFGAGGSSQVTTNITLNSSALTTAWARYTGTVTLPSISGKTIGTSSFLEIDFGIILNTTFTFDTWGWQLEAANTATAFQTATGTIQGELAACQRYYFRLNATDVYTRWAPAIGQNGTSVQAVLNYPVQMRIKPTSLDYSNLAVYDTATVTNVTSASFTDGGANSTYVQLNVASGITQYRPYQLLAANNAAAFIGLSAEL
jgi:hypothetical protein